MDRQTLKSDGAKWTNNLTLRSELRRITSQAPRLELGADPGRASRFRAGGGAATVGSDYVTRGGQKRKGETDTERWMDGWVGRQMGVGGHGEEKQGAGGVGDTKAGKRERQRGNESE